MYTRNFKMTSQRLIGVASFTALSLALAGASHAGDMPADRTVIIEFQSASAATAQGAKALYLRVRGAAQYVCSVLDHGDLASKRNFGACVRRTIGETVARENRDALTAAFHENYPSIPGETLLAAQQR